jgi:hypothetical protein
LLKRPDCAGSRGDGSGTKRRAGPCQARNRKAGGSVREWHGPLSAPALCGTAQQGRGLISVYLLTQKRQSSLVRWISVVFVAYGISLERPGLGKLMYMSTDHQ